MTRTLRYNFIVQQRKCRTCKSVAERQQVPAVCCRNPVHEPLIYRTQQYWTTQQPKSALINTDVFTHFWKGVTYIDVINFHGYLKISGNPLSIWLMDYIQRTKLKRLIDREWCELFFVLRRFNADSGRSDVRVRRRY